MPEKLPFKVAQAVKKFHRHRAAYYLYVADILHGSGGNIKILQLFENDIERYAGKPRGILCGLWFDRYSENGGNLADTFEGCLPDDEVAIIRVSQDAGGDALIVALKDVGRIAKLSDKIRKESLSTLTAALFGVALAVAMLTIFPVFSVNAIAKAYDFLPLEYWGKNGKSLVAYADWIKRYILFVAVFVTLVLVGVHWSLANLVSPIREWLDEKVVLYRVIRDVKGAMFLATMSTLTRKRGGVMFTLKQSLETFSDSARTPWLKWRINQVIDGADVSGAVGVEAFKTGLISPEMFFYLEDMQKAKGFADGFEETGRYVETTILDEIIKRMMIYRWALLLAAMVVTLAVFGWQFKVIYEMRGAMSSFLASG
jgi:type II secretory pathway component PulF